MDWSRLEVEAIIADYLQMLTLELAGQSYSKTTHRQNLQQKLQSRSDSSVEFKHANISAAMVDLGFRTYAATSPDQTTRRFWQLLQQNKFEAKRCWTARRLQQYSSPQ